MSEEEISPVEALRLEFKTELDAMKDAFAAETKERDDRIADLTKMNEDLRRELVRNTVLSPQPEPIPEKSPEDLYREEVERDAKKAIDLIKGGSFL